MTAPPPLAPRPASIGRRMCAFAIDVAVACGLATVLGILLVVVVMGSSARRDYALVAVVATTSYAVLLACLLAWWLVYSAMQGGRGSIGQRALGLRLHDASSPQPIGFWRAVLRNVVWGLAGSIVVGYFTPLFDSSPRRQGWHDLAARATVVDVRGIPDAAAAASARHTANPYLAPAGAAPGPWPWGQAPTERSAPRPAPSATPATMPVSVPVLVAPATAAVAPTVYASAPAPAGPAGSSPATYASAPATYAPAPVAYAPAPTPAVLAPAAAVPVPAPAAPVLMPAGRAAAEDVDETRVPASVPPPAQRAALYPDAPVLAVLTWDDGTRMAVYGRTLYGRNPAGEPGAVTVAVRDETLSLSKTHFEIGSDERGPWIVDRHSTNGTVLVRDGGRHPLEPGVRTLLRDADRLELGDRSTGVGIA